MRAKQLVNFLALFSLILGIFHFYLYQGSVYYLQLNALANNFLAYIFAFLRIITMLAMSLMRLLQRFFTSIISFIVYLWMGFSLLLFTGFFIADLLWIMLNLISPESASLHLQKNFDYFNCDYFSCEFIN
jgi:hypothetical protein